MESLVSIWFRGEINEFSEESVKNYSVWQAFRILLLACSRRRREMYTLTLRYMWIGGGKDLEKGRNGRMNRWFAPLFETFGKTMETVERFRFQTFFRGPWWKMAKLAKCEKSTRQLFPSKKVGIPCIRFHPKNMFSTLKKASKEETMLSILSLSLSFSLNQENFF